MLDRLLPRYLKGFRGMDLFLGLLLLPVLVPFSLIFRPIGWLLDRAQAVREWWWNS